MTLAIESIISTLNTKLTTSGFLPMREFSAVDSLVHPDDMLGVIRLENCSVAGQALENENLTFCIETDYRLDIHLFGKSGDFVDYETFSTACTQLFYDIVRDGSLIICKMEMSGASQSMPLRRLERIMSVTVRALERPGV